MAGTGRKRQGWRAGRGVIEKPLTGLYAVCYAVLLSDREEAEGITVGEALPIVLVGAVLLVAVIAIATRYNQRIDGGRRR